MKYLVEINRKGFGSKFLYADGTLSVDPDFSRYAFKTKEDAESDAKTELLNWVDPEECSVTLLEITPNA